jgi:hypothetical protein
VTAGSIHLDAMEIVELLPTSDVHNVAANTGIQATVENEAI